MNGQLETLWGQAPWQCRATVRDIYRWFQPQRADTAVVLRVGLYFPPYRIRLGTGARVFT